MNKVYKYIRDCENCGVTFETLEESKLVCCISNKKCLKCKSEISTEYDGQVLCSDHYLGNADGSIPVLMDDGTFELMCEFCGGWFNSLDPEAECCSRPHDYE